MPQKVSHDSHKNIRSYAAGQLITAQENLPLDLQHSYSPQSARSHQSPSLADSLTQVWLFLQTSLHCNKINNVTSQSPQVTWASVWKLHTELVTKECWIPTSVGKCIFICQHLVQHMPASLGAARGCSQRRFPSFSWSPKICLCHNFTFPKASTSWWSLPFWGPILVIMALMKLPVGSYQSPQIELSLLSLLKNLLCWAIYFPTPVEYRF